MRGAKTKYFGPLLLEHKICAKCGEHKPLTQFNSNGQCKQCASKSQDNINQYGNKCADCGNKCSYRATRCRSCEDIFRTGSMHPGWKGGRVLRKGYVYVCHNGKQIAEHRMVMSGVLGRPLYKGEEVHHKNGVKDDNRPENLELWVKSQPSGQRPEDLVAWAKEILERYEK